jgi:formamidopyrimidine-DNA glycosylase
MPEGPEVETVRRSLAPLVVGLALGRARVSRLKLRTPITSRQLAFLDGSIVDRVGRHGKLLWLQVESGAGLCIRLGMTGQLTVAEAKTPPLPHTHVRIALGDGARELRYCDPRRFGEVVPFAAAAGLQAERQDMGPDGITLDDAGRTIVADGLRRTGRAIKEALLDQRLVAGVGNIYAAEACFIAGLNPTRAGASLSATEARALVAAVEETLAQGVARRGTSFSDYVDAEGVQGDNAAHLWVFQREGEACRRCGSVIERFVQGQRSTFLCPRCQRP